MAIIESVKNKGVDKLRESLLLESGKLVKANLIYFTETNKEMFRVPVQFNPNQYSISRSLTYKTNNGQNEEASPAQLMAAKGNLATLNVSLQLDSATPAAAESILLKLKKWITKEKELYDLIGIFSELMKFNYDEHAPNKVMFDWGTLHFLGKVTSMNMTYTMFNRDGKPVKAKVDMSIIGEENDLLKKIKVNPKQSPDRTKYRSLGPADELWMLAENEYGDASAWREIAKENGILSPRQLEKGKMLKVPSI